MEIDNKVYNAIVEALNYSAMTKKCYFIICHNPKTGDIEIVLLDKEIFEQHIPHNNKSNGWLHLGYCYDGKYKPLDYD